MSTFYDAGYLKSAAKSIPRDSNTAESNELANQQNRLVSDAHVARESRVYACICFIRLSRISGTYHARARENPLDRTRKIRRERERKRDREIERGKRCAQKTHSANDLYC